MTETAWISAAAVVLSLASMVINFLAWRNMRATDKIAEDILTRLRQKQLITRPPKDE